MEWPLLPLLQEWHCDTDVVNGNHVTSHKCFLLGCMVSILSQNVMASLQFSPGCYSGSAVSGIMLILVSYLVRGVLCLGEPMPQGCKDCLVVQRCRFFILATFFSHNTETKPKLTDTRVLGSFMST